MGDGRRTQPVTQLLDHKKHLLPILARVSYIDTFGTPALTIPAVWLASVAAHLSLTTINACSVSCGAAHGDSNQGICLDWTSIAMMCMCVGMEWDYLLYRALLVAVK